MTIKIVLVEPKISGNIGVVARVMKNFNFDEIVLINPQAEIVGDTFGFAKHAQEVLDNIRIKGIITALFYLSKFIFLLSFLKRKIS